VSSTCKRFPFIESLEVLSIMVFEFSFAGFRLENLSFVVLAAQKFLTWTKSNKNNGKMNTPQKIKMPILTQKTAVLVNIDSGKCFGMKYNQSPPLCS